MKTLSRVLIAICLLVSTQTLVAQQCINLKAQNANCTCKENSVNNLGEIGYKNAHTGRLAGSPYYQQWHLTSYGKDSGNCAYNTYHLKVEDVWKEYKGKGVYIAIVEPDIIPAKGSEYVVHADLIENLSTKHSVDYTPNKDIQISHGIEVAGVAAARGYNKFGVRGVAPLATIISVGMRPSISQHRIAAAAHQNEITAVYNNSWGVQEFVDVSSMWYRAIETGLSEGFYGKGSVYVWATANEYGENSANFEPVTNYHATIAVCAVNYRGVHNNDSVTGANLWVCGLSQDSTDNDDWKYYIVTTTAHKDKTDPRNITSDANIVYAEYSRTFSGTSAAAPMVTGVVALMRQANPNLGWRDVKLILAETARKVEKTDAGWLRGGIRYAKTNERYHFNHKYGFGLVDAEEAVALAETWVNVPERVADTVVEDIPPSVIDTEKLTRTIDVQSDIDFIEHVDATIDIKRPERMGLYVGLMIKLKSPSGTVSTLASDKEDGGDDGGGELKWRYGSARHLGEDASGEWQLMIERKGYSTNNFKFQGWELRIRGFKVEMDAVADDDLSDLNTSATSLTLSLSGAHWKKSLQLSDFSLKNAPSGLSIAEVQPTSDTQVVQLKLDFDGTLDDKYDFQVQANIGTVTNLSRALVSNDIKIARVALKTTTIPQSTVGTQYHYTMKNAFASPTSLTYIIKLVDEEGNVLDTQIPGLTIDGHTIRGIPETVGTHRLRVEATRTTDDASRTEYFVFSVEPHTIEVQLRVLLEGLQPPNPN